MAVKTPSLGAHGSVVVGVGAPGGLHVPTPFSKSSTQTTKVVVGAVVEVVELLVELVLELVEELVVVVESSTLQAPR
jgi:hypothetical protein